MHFWVCFEEFKVSKVVFFVVRKNTLHMSKVTVFLFIFWCFFFFFCEDQETCGSINVYDLSRLAQHVADHSLKVGAATSERSKRGWQFLVFLNEVFFFKWVFPCFFFFLNVFQWFGFFYFFEKMSFLMFLFLFLRSFSGFPLFCLVFSCAFGMMFDHFWP